MRVFWSVLRALFAGLLGEACVLRRSTCPGAGLDEGSPGVLQGPGVAGGAGAGGRGAGCGAAALRAPSPRARAGCFGGSAASRGSKSRSSAPAGVRARLQGLPPRGARECRQPAWRSRPEVVPAGGRQVGRLGPARPGPAVFTWLAGSPGAGGGAAGAPGARSRRRQSSPRASEDEPAAPAARVPDPEGGAGAPGPRALGARAARRRPGPRGALVLGAASAARWVTLAGGGRALLRPRSGDRGDPGAGLPRAAAQVAAGGSRAAALRGVGAGVDADPERRGCPQRVSRCGLGRAWRPGSRAERRRG